MARFKVGDAVRVVQDAITSRKGETGIVEYDNGKGDYDVRLDKGGVVLGFNDEELENADKLYSLLKASSPVANDPVNHPSHYTSHPKGIEALDVIEDNPYYNLAAAMKYIWRVSWGGKKDDLEDLKKAEFYIHREVEKRSK